MASPGIDELAERDLDNRYMPSPDATNLLAYLDAGKLFGLVGDPKVWPLVAPVLMKQARWEGTTDELRAIRNRIAHLRRPHHDDRRRIEQTLRDLEPGARIALEAFNRQHPVPTDAGGVATAWVEGRHPEAQRLIAHAASRYDIDFRLDYSVRPSASVPAEGPLLGHAGVLVHASWTLRPSTPRSVNNPVNGTRVVVGVGGSPSA